MLGSRPIQKRLFKIELKLFNIRQLCSSLKLIGYWKALINIKKYKKVEDRSKIYLNCVVRVVE